MTDKYNKRCNVEETEDGVRICLGHHERSQGCNWEYFIRTPSAPKQTDGWRPIAEAPLGSMEDRSTHFIGTAQNIDEGRNWTVARCYRNEHGAYEWWGGGMTPTHWKPLDPPPDRPINASLCGGGGMTPAYRIGQWVWNSTPKDFARDIRNWMRIADIEKTDTHYRLHLTNRHANVITGWTRLFIPMLLMATPAHADCTTRPMDDHGGVVHVCAEVVDMVDTERPTVNADELADMMAVARLAEGDEVVINMEGEGE